MTSSGPPKRYFAPGPTEPLGGPVYTEDYCSKPAVALAKGGGGWWHGVKFDEKHVGGVIESSILKKLYL